VDNLSLMALVLAVGFVVDDAIVMLENIVRHLEMGEGVLEAALNGSKEISFTILSMTLSLAAVFIPVLFMGGILGRLLHEFSVTIMSAVLVSGLVSLTLTPMLCSRFLRHAKPEEHGFLFNLFERGFSGMLGAYDWSLKKVLRFRFVTFLFSLAIIGLTLWLFVKMPKGFLPSEDGGHIMGITMAQQGISFDSMKAHQQALTSILLTDPNVDNLMSFAGAGAGLGGGNNGFFFLDLKERPSGRTQMVEWFKDRLHISYPHDPQLRYLDTDQVLQSLRPRLMGVPGIIAFMQNPPPIQIGGHLTSSEYQFTVQGADTSELYRESMKLADQLRSVSGLQDLNTDLQVSNPQVNVEIDRDKAEALGVSAYQVEDALEASYSSRRVSTIYTPNNEYAVVLELEPQYQMDPQALSLLYIHSSNGQNVPLSAVSKFTQSLGPLQVNHTGQLPSVTVSFNLRPGTALGDVVNRVEEIARQSLPSDLTANFEGAAQQFESSLVGLTVLLIITILVIYIVLGVLYESFIHPLTILSGLPSAALGALLTLKWFGKELDLYAFVGIIMLIGIVKKNAIMMIDFALDAERKSGKSTQEAIYYGALVRFRPIMMTTMAALMGTLPIAVGFGAGAEARRPLGLCVVGGLVFSQFITLYITPVYYTYLDSFQKWTQGLFGSKRRVEFQPAPELHEEPVAGRRS
jgi:HAE1 family hydrophobic/amphiphilic exporter-1